MVKYWYHPEGQIRENGCFCTYCGKKLEEKLQNLHPEKCKIATAAVSLWNGYMFEISVWNLIPSLLVFKQKESGERIYLKLEVSPEIEAEYQRLLYSCPYEAGGAINISGIYPLSTKFEAFLEKHLADGNIKIINPRLNKIQEG